MLNLDPGMMFWTWVTFFIVLFILYKLALKPILSAVENREKSVRDDLDEARRQRDEAASLLEKHQELMDKAETEAQQILKDNQDLADKTRQEMLDKAREESSRLLDKAKEEIERQKDGALASLKAEVADLAVGAAEKIILQSLDKEKQKKIVDEYIKSMPKSLNN